MHWFEQSTQRSTRHGLGVQSLSKAPFLNRLRARDYIIAMLVYFVGSNTKTKDSQ